MSNSMYDSRTADKFVLRLPAGMRDAIAEAAGAGHRSMNSEIVQRLEKSLLDDTVEPWTPVVGMLVVYKCDDAQTQPMKIKMFNIQKQEGSSIPRVWFRVEMPSGYTVDEVYADLCRPYIVK